MLVLAQGSPEAVARAQQLHQRPRIGQRDPTDLVRSVSVNVGLPT
ncbi:hypothetical protein [Streptomyces himalayensis]|nr:hypothetical protein [Streptomyces himalayensis]